MIQAHKNTIEVLSEVRVKLDTNAPSIPFLGELSHQVAKAIDMIKEPINMNEYFHDQIKVCCEEYFKAKESETESLSDLQDRVAELEQDIEDFPFDIEDLQTRMDSVEEEMRDETDIKDVLADALHDVAKSFKSSI